MVLVDSCIWIESARAQGQLIVKLALRGLLEEDEACFCGPIKLEILGALRAELREKFSSQMELVPYISIAEAQWDDAVKFSWHLRNRGITAPWNDILIASVALKRNVRLYSIDAHFEAISRVSGLALYQPGYNGAFNPE